MNEDLGGIREALRRAMLPLTEGPRRDLWPDLERRMAAPESPRFVWIDWIVGAGTVTAAVALPRVVPTLLYLL